MFLYDLSLFFMGSWSDPTLPSLGPSLLGGPREIIRGLSVLFREEGELVPPPFSLMFRPIASVNLEFVYLARGNIAGRVSKISVLTWDHPAFPFFGPFLPQHRVFRGSSLKDGAAFRPAHLQETGSEGIFDPSFRLGWGSFCKDVYGPYQEGTSVVYAISALFSSNVTQSWCPTPDFFSDRMRELDLHGLLQQKQKKKKHQKNQNPKKKKKKTKTKQKKKTQKKKPFGGDVYCGGLGGGWGVVFFVGGVGGGGGVGAGGGWVFWFGGGFWFVWLGGGGTTNTIFWGSSVRVRGLFAARHLSSSSSLFLLFFAPRLSFRTL